MADINKIVEATQNFIDEVPDYWHRGQYRRTSPETVINNLGYATPRELEWCASATEADIKARALRPAFRPIEDGTLVNPFWYHASINPQ
jgi:hypothetical protein